MKFLCPSRSLAPNSSLGFDIDGCKLLAVHRNGIAYFCIHRCPHRGIPLEWHPDQFLDDSASLIQCATHSALFLIESGECIAGPCAGKNLKALRGREDEHGLWVDL